MSNAGKIWAIGAGMGTQTADGSWLEAWYPLLLTPDDSQSAELDEILAGQRGLLTNPPAALTAKIAAIMGTDEASALATLPATAGHRRSLCLILSADNAIDDAATAYLKLHLLSARLTRPNSLNLEGLFQQLPNLAWTSSGPLPPAEVASVRLERQRQGDTLWVHSVDKFPPLTQYLLPAGVRIADTARVRLGAWLGKGTTIMHSGAVNFNAGTCGTAMIEGRISAGVILGENSDLGGGASTMGRLSGGGVELVSLGANCLIGANAGLGIPLGDRCTVESGLYLTAAAKVVLLDEAGKPQSECAARTLAGRDDLLFWRNSLSGAIECRPNPKRADLNPDLHDHN